MNKSDKIFKVKQLGQIKFILPIIDFDYPRVFLCKKDDSFSLTLYLFKEFNHDDSSISWICVQTSVDEIDRLNRGIICLESCFRGPRLTSKSGYIVKSSVGEEEAESTYCDDISSFIKSENTFVDEFISDENEGVNLLSAIYEKPFFATVLKPERYADPLIDASRITCNSELFKSMINCSPFMVESKKCCYSQNRSLVAYYEISDKRLLGKNQLPLIDDFNDNSETHLIFNAINTILDSHSEVSDIINAFKGDKKSIEKTSEFINEIKNNAKNTPIEIHAADYHNKTINSPIVVSIDKDTSKNVKQKTAEAIKIIDSEENHIRNEITVVGQFLMLDTTGRKKFKFQSFGALGKTQIYSGFSKCDVSGIAVDETGEARYKVKILIDILKGQFGTSNPIYFLTKIIEKINSPEQLSIFKDF